MPKNTCPLSPLDDRVVVLTDEPPSRTRGGIVLPEGAKEKPTRGVVAKVGPGKLLDSGQRAEPQIRVGDAVLFNLYAGQTVEVGGAEWLVLRESDVLAVV